MFPTTFRVYWPFSSGEEEKIYFQDGGHLGFPIGSNLAFFFIYKSPRCFLPSFESTGLSFQEKKRKIDFQDGSRGGYLGFKIETILAIFDLRVTPMLPKKFQVSCLFGSGEEANNFRSE